MYYGIDLGTTKSSIGFWRDGKPFIIPDKYGNLSIPSMVLVTPEKEIFAGVQAEKHPDRYNRKAITISSVKRLTGKQGETGWGWWKTYPQEVAAFILSELKYQAEQYTGEKVTDAVIAIPSHFDERQRRATKEAAWIAGINVLKLINESTLAVVTYSMDRQREEFILVFDIGGGTSDISVAQIGDGVVEIKSTEGDSKLGGDDFDQIIVDYILDRVYKQHGIHIDLDIMQEIILHDVAERAKIELSSKLNAHVYVPGFFNAGGKHYDLDILINRKTFEKLSESLFDQSINMINKALKSAGLEPADIDHFLLLGGSSRIPYFRELLNKEFNLSPITGLDIETCVAQGAIINAAILKGHHKETLLLDVIANSYGIEAQGGVFSKLIEKNTTSPAKKTQVFTTTENNQTSLSIRLYQGENAIASDNAFLGTIELKGVIPAKKGATKIEVTFDIDMNMIAHVSARDVASGKTEKIRIQSPYSLNDSQLRLMSRKLSTWQVERQLFNN